MSISEFLKLRNAIFFLAEEQAHAQVKKVQIKPSFILKLLTCVSGNSSFLKNGGHYDTPPSVPCSKNQEIKKIDIKFQL